MLHAAQLLREPTRARPFPHPSRQSFGIVARRQKSLCATRNRHRRPSPPLRLSLASISAARACVSDRCAIYRQLLFAANGPHGTPRSSARDVVCHARGGARAAHDDARDHSMEAPAGHRTRATLSRGKVGRAARARSAPPTACSITRPCRRLPAPENSRRQSLPSACSRLVISTASRPMTIAYCCVTSSRSTTSGHRGRRTHRGSRGRAHH